MQGRGFVKFRADEPLTEALRLQRDAAALGFDWRHLQELWDKLAEETLELQQAAGQGPEAVEDELGDLLFMVVNIARHLGADPSEALVRANAKFARRFTHVMAAADALPPLGDPARLWAMEQRWQDAKQFDKAR